MPMLPTRKLLRFLFLIDGLITLVGSPSRRAGLVKAAPPLSSLRGGSTPKFDSPEECITWGFAVFPDMIGNSYAFINILGNILRPFHSLNSVA